VLLLAAPSVASASARHWNVITMVAMYGFGMLGDAWIFRGRHFGWMALGAVIAMAAVGHNDQGRGRRCRLIHRNRLELL